MLLHSVFTLLAGSNRAPAWQQGAIAQRTADSIKSGHFWAHGLQSPVSLPSGRDQTQTFMPWNIFQSYTPVAALLPYTHPTVGRNPVAAEPPLSLPFLPSPLTIWVLGTLFGFDQTTQFGTRATINAPVKGIKWPVFSFNLMYKHTMLCPDLTQITPE